MSVLFSYCFQPYEHHFLIASFNVLVSQLLRRRQGKTRLSYTTRRKSYKNYSSSTPIASNLHLSIDWKIFRSWKCQFGSKHQAMASRGWEIWLKKLKLKHFHGTALLHSELPMTNALGLVTMLHVQNLLEGDLCFSCHFFVMNEWNRSLGTPVNLVLYGLIFPLSIPAKRILNVQHGY